MGISVHRKVAVSVVTVAIVVLTVSAWFVYAQFIGLQAQIKDLQTQNSELESQISNLQSRITELEDRNRQLKNRVIELMEQQGKYTSPVKVTALEWIGGFNPIGSLTLAYPVNVTIQNKGDVDARGLSLTVKLINIYDGSQIGQSGGTNISQIGKSGPVETLSPGETREIRAWTYCSLSESLADAACVVTLKQGNTVLDEWILVINHPSD